MKYIIPCYWTMYGELIIEANSLYNALIKIEQDTPLPPSGSYLNNSLDIDNDALVNLYPDEPQ